LGIASREEAATVLPLLLVLYAVLAVTYAVTLLSVDELRAPLLFALFTALMAMHAVLHGFSPRLRAAAQKDEGWMRLAAYLSVQGLLLLGMSALVGEQGFMVVLYVVLAGQAAAITWPNVRAAALVVLACLGLFALSGILDRNLESLAGWLPAVALLASFAFVLSVVYVDLSRSRNSARLLHQELELARQRQQIYATLAEDLTIAQQQQCIAQELYGELTENLTEMVHRLEAEEATLEDGDSGEEPAEGDTWVLERAQQTLQLAERARLALQSTPQEQGSLIESLIKQVDRFTTRTGIQASLEVDDLDAKVPPELSTGVQRIVQESLANVALHAQASQVSIQVQTREEELKVVVQDDGTGFNVAQSMLQPDCRGLSDMHERARRLGGHLRLESIPGSGTRIVLTLQL
jgi:signal transduction histidine kinase